MGSGEVRPLPLHEGGAQATQTGQLTMGSFPETPGKPGVLVKRSAHNTNRGIE